MNTTEKISGRGDALSVTNRINDFLASPGSVAAVAALTVLTHMLALEAVLYTLFAGLTVYVCFWGRDLLPLMPVVICSYIAPSVENNPGRSESSVFYPGHGGIYLLCLGVCMAASLIAYCVRNRKRYCRRKYRLLSGFLVLSAAYLLGGLGSAAYPDLAGRHLLFALLQGGALLLPYVLFAGGVDWDKARNDYFAWVGFCVGGVLMAELLWAYLRAGVVVDGVIHRQLLYTGWGMHNNIGGVLAMMIPFAFYLASKYRRGWLGSVFGSLFLIGVLMSCSRSSILAGCLIYLACVVAMLLYARNRRGNTIAVASIVAVAVLAGILFHAQIYRLFSDVLEKGLDPSDRDVIYREGLALFRQAPLLGNSFFSPGYTPWEWSELSQFSSFFPPRWHNTVVQLLTCCGVVGLGAYLFHRAQTVVLLVKNRSMEKVFIGFSIIVLLVGSLFDCHFFNIGPGMFYAMALAFVENSITGEQGPVAK